MFNIFSFIKSWFVKIEDRENGLIKSPDDFRDVKAKDLLGAIELTPLPETYRIPYSLPTKNQENTPECVGWSCASIKDEKERREQNETDANGSFIYKEAKKIDGIPNIKGTYFRIGLQVMKTIGVQMLPTSKIQGLPAIFKIGWYIRVDCDIESLKRAIYQWGAVLIGFHVYPDSWNSAYIKKGTIVVGGHATIAVGWNKDYIIGQNSYGENWGDKGYFYFNENYLPFESWAVVSDIPTNLLPNPSDKPKHTFKKDLFVTLRDPEVKILDECLQWLGCEPKDTESNDYFGKPTQEAVKVFQKRYNINGTGRCGPLTRMFLNNLFSS
uniref:Putative peptidoglycan binding protein n=1 Tax=viral metagenome TaxID=1070528 RepID=A0A6H1ZFI8_9ZZZZ